MGFFSDFFGTPSDDQVNRDSDRGHAQPRNDAEDDAAFDYADEALGKGSDPIPDEAPSWANDIPTPGGK